MWIILNGDRPWTSGETRILGCFGLGIRHQPQMGKLGFDKIRTQYQAMGMRNWGGGVDGSSIPRPVGYPVLWYGFIQDPLKLGLEDKIMKAHLWWYYRVHFDTQVTGATWDFQ